MKQVIKLILNKQFYLTKLKRIGLFRSVTALDINLEEYKHSGEEYKTLSNYHKVRIFIVENFFYYNHVFHEIKIQQSIQHIYLVKLVIL